MTRPSDESAAARRQLLAARVMLVTAIVLTVALRVASMPSRGFLFHDEAVSLVLSAGASDAYYEVTERRPAYPSGAWVSPQRWSSFENVSGLDAGGVLKSVALSDRHPPLYYLLLHFWRVVFGSAYRTAQALNILLAVGTACVVYLLGRETLDNQVMAGAAAIGYALSPGAVASALVVRQYELLALLGVTLVLLTVRLVRSEERSFPILVGLGVVSALGVLTHLYFWLVIAAAIGWGVAATMRSRPRVAVALFSAVVAGALLSVGVQALVSPKSVAVVQEGSRATAAVDTDQQRARVGRALRTVSAGVGVDGSVRLARAAASRSDDKPPRVTWFLLYTAAILGIAGGAIAVHRDRAKTRLGRGAPVLVAFAIATAGAIAVHVMVPSLGHAMSPRYLALTWPFGVLVLAWVADLWEVPTAYWVVSLFAVPLVVANVYVVGIAPRKAAPPIAGSARHVVVDNLARGVLLPYVHQTGPDTLVYAQSRTELLKAPEEWLERLGPGDLVVVIDMYGNKKKDKPKLLSLVEERWTLRAERAQGLRGTGYRVLTTR